MRIRSAFAVLMFCALATGAVRGATISGFVHSASDGEALSYASVSLQGTRSGDIANEKGYYIIPDVPAGDYQVVFSHTGYAPETRTVSLEEQDQITLTVELQPRAIEMEEVEVKAGPNELLLEPSKLTLRTRELMRIPPVAEVDLFRSVQSLPGVSTLSDFSSGLYVRGGSADQNLILLDDLDVYNPSHLFGFFSTFNVDAVRTVDLQKSGYPARYGGRLSSLLDVHNRDGNRKHLQGKARLSVIGATATVDGPWKRGSWMIAGRHTFIEGLSRAAGMEIPYNFYDLHGKFNYDVTPENKTSLSVFRGRDRLDWDRENLDVLLDWGNDTWSAQWTHLFSRRLFSHFLVGYSRFDSQGKIAFQDFAFRLRNRIEDVSTKGNLSFTPSASHLVDFGFETKAMDFYFQRARGEDEEFSFEYNGVYAALYAQDNWRTGRGWQLQPGLRLDYYSEGDYLNLGPRITVRRPLDVRVSVHATYGRYYQYLNLFSEEGASFGDMWFPVDETLAPGRADQFIVGIDLGPYDHFDLAVETYYKSYGNVAEFSTEFGRSLIEDDAELGEAFLTGEGRAYGADLYLRNKIAGFDGWIGYTWGDTRRKINGFNYGEEFHPKYDRRHQIVLMEDYYFGKGWRANLSFRYGSGQPTTLGAGRYTARDIAGREFDAILSGELNASRLPDYHRLDIGVSYRIDLGDAVLEPSLQIINVYDHENVYIRYYDTGKNPVETEDVTMLPFLPTVGINVSF